MKEQQEKFQFTTDNLLANLDKLGAWSSYGLASSALLHWFPSEYDENDNCDTNREIELMQSIGCNSWQDVVRKFHSEIGYKPEDGNFSPMAVNAY